MSIDIASPGGDEAALRTALQGLLGWVNVDAAGAASANPAWDQAVQGSQGNVSIVGLSAVRDILLIARLVTKATTGVLQAFVSVDNGSSYYTTSGDYVIPAVAGTETNTTNMGSLHDTNATAARSGFCLIYGANINGVPKFAYGNSSNIHRLFVASTSPIDAVRISPSGGGNLTGGKIYCLVRR